MIWPLTITLAGVPRGKGAPRASVAGGHVRAYTDAKTRAYEAQLRFAAQQAMACALPTAEPLDIHIIAGMPIPQSFSRVKRAAAIAGTLRPVVKPDCNNLSKALDSLNGVVWIDDKQIVEEHVSKVYAEAPYLKVIVRLMGPALDQPSRPTPTLPTLTSPVAIGVARTKRVLVTA